MNSSGHLHDFKGIGYSKIGYFKEVRSKIKELENLNYELNRRHNKLEAIFNSMNEGLTVLNRDLDIVSANRVQLERFPESTIIGKKCHQVFYEKRTVCKDCPVIRMLVTGEPGRGETYIKKGRFSGRYFEWAVSPVKDPFGGIDEIILVMSDISERKEYEFKLIQADKMSTVGFLAAGVAHEINNPLTSIAGFSEGLLKRLATPGIFENEKFPSYLREYLEIINSEAYRCRDIIRNLLDYSRNSGDDFNVIPIDATIRDTMALFRQHARDRHIGIVFKNNLAPDANCIWGNEFQLKYIFMNLFNRAFRNMSMGGELNISAKNSGQMIEILISEHKNPNTIQEDYDPEDSEDFSTEKVEHGEMTLSMSVCYNIVRQHHAEILFPTKNGLISTYTLRLPLSNKPNIPEST